MLDDVGQAYDLALGEDRADRDDARPTFERFHDVVLFANALGISSSI